MPSKQSPKEWTPEEGVVDVMEGVLGKEVKPSSFRRSWQKGKRAPGTYEASFDYEDATVYLNGLAPNEWKAFEAKEKELFKERQAFEDEVNNRVEAEKERIAARQKSKAKIPPEQTEAERQEGLEVAEAWKARKTELDAQQMEILQELVSMSVVGWDGAPIPYAPGAVDELPPEIVIEWAAQIVESSRLSQKEADFLAHKSPA